MYDPGDRSDSDTGVSIYRDGALRGNPRSSPGAKYASYDIAGAWSGSLTLGTRDLGSFFTGALDDVAIYPRVLDAGAENFHAAGN